MRPRAGALLTILLLPTVARAEGPEGEGAGEDSLRFELHADYRARYHSLHDIFFDGEGGVISADVEDATFVTHRLWIDPAVVYGPNPDSPIGALRLRISALENVVWGDNAGLTTPALFASDLSSTGRDAEEQPTVELERAWLELMIPVGQIRVGRMGSHWGLGLLSNDGDREQELGDTRFSSEVDRILFATRPVSVYRALRGRPPGSHPLIFAVGYDQLVDDPVEEDDPPRAPFGGWVADPEDDVDEVVFLLLWKDDELHRWRAADQLHLGIYYVNRRQDSSNSAVHIFDVYGRIRWGPWFGVAEGYQIIGSSQAIPLPPPPDTEDLPDRKSAEIIGWAARGGYERGRWTAQAEIGHASGDDNVQNDVFSGRPLHPAYHVGLVLFQQVLAEATAQRWTEDARGYWSNGGVYNATYGMLTGKLRPLPGLELLLSGLYAVPDEVDGSIIRTDAPYGFELDGAAKVHFQEYFHYVLEGGVLFPGQALWGDFEWCDGPPSRECGGNGVGRDPAWTVQTRIAMVF